MSRLTLEKIAEIAGVSRSTASRVLRNHGSVSNAARERVLRAIDETGYQPNAAARLLAGHRTNIIGLVISEIAQAVLGDPYFGRLMEGITQSANSLDQTVTLFLFHDAADVERFTTRNLQNQLVDGLIVSNTVMDNQIINHLLGGNLPFVVVGRHETPQVSYLDADNIGGAQMAVNHLLRTGYRRIGTLTGTMDNFSAIDRLEGYRQALLNWRREIDPNLIHYGEFVEISGYDGMKKLLKQNVDAVFAASDSIALGAIRAINEAGLSVPDDIAVVGFDDLPFAAVSSPPLTTIRQTIRRTGALAVETLIESVNDGGMSVRRLSLPTELVIRKSCGAVR